ncbi:MAG: hypothetical protein O2960_24785, partial [Verrucomicrobia bacterium]|nr:hypothetical protein [Verrucomicrobiota bacterium]
LTHCAIADFAIPISPTEFRDHRNMSHEIRTPLNAILGYAQILRRTPNLPADQQAAVRTIQSSGEHLLNLINQVLDLSKIEAGAIELAETDFDLRELILCLSAMFDPRCREKGLEWKVEWDGSVIRYQRAVINELNADMSRRPGNWELEIENLKLKIPLRGDEGKLRQILINILGNAVKFTESGRITLRVAGTEDVQHSTVDRILEILSRLA